MAALHPLRTLLLAFTGWISRHQAEVIEYLLEENRVLKEQMAGTTATGQESHEQSAAEIPSHAPAYPDDPPRSPLPGVDTVLEGEVSVAKACSTLRTPDTGAP